MTDTETALLAEASDPTTAPERLWAIYNDVTVQEGLVSDEARTLIYAAVARNPNVGRQLLFDAAEEGNLIEAMQNPALDLMLLSEPLGERELRSLTEGLVWILGLYVSRPGYLQAARSWQRSTLPLADLKKRWERMVDSPNDPFVARDYLRLVWWQMPPVGYNQAVSKLLRAWEAIQAKAYAKTPRAPVVSAEDRFPYDAELARLRTWLP